MQRVFHGFHFQRKTELLLLVHNEVERLMEMFGKELRLKHLF